MRKILHLILSFLLIFSFMGISVQTHYCGGYLAYQQVYTLGDEGSCCGDDEMSNSCCENEFHLFQLNEKSVQLKQISIPSIFKIISILSPVNFNFISNFINSKHLLTVLPVSPPIRETKFLLFLSLLI